jgi:tetratricopeptide (TPR) repeat protein
VQLLAEHKYQEADDEASLAIKALNFDPSLDASDLMAAYLTRSHALCSMGHCEKALEDLAHARSAAEGRLAANSLEMVALWATEGMDQMRTGHVEEGSRAMREALRLAKSRTDLPETMVSQLQLGMLREYAGALKDAHRKDEAKQVEAEAVRLQERVPQGCGGCTVGVAALAFAPPR